MNVEKKASGGQKRKSEDKAEGDDALTKNEEGKEVRASGKKQKTEKTEKPEKQTNGTAADGEKKGKGRPKKGETSAKKEKKPAKPRATEGIGSRTRSRA